MPDLQPPNLLPPMAGLALLSQIAERRQQNQLAMERMVQESALRQQTLAQEADLKREQFKVDRETLAQRAPLIDQQVENQKAEANERNARANAYWQGVGNATQQRTETAKRAGEFAAAMSEMQKQYPFGTEAWNSNAPIVASQFTDIQHSREYARVWGENVKQNAEAHKQVLNNQLLVRKNYNDFFTKYKPLSPQTLDNPNWGSNDNGSKYLNYDASGNILPPNTDVKGNPGKYFSVTVPGNALDTAIKQRDTIDEWNSKNLNAPAPQNVIRQTPASLPVVNSDDDFDALSPGQQFVDPNGKVRIKQ